MSISTPSFFSHFYHALIRFFAHHKTYSAALFVLLVGIMGYGYFSVPKTTEARYRVTYGTLEQYVKVSGAVASSKDASLAFQTTGAVSFVGVRTGDTVTQGQVLATINSADAQASVLQAEAALASAQANLASLKQGARKEELASKEQVLLNAKNSLDQAYASIPDAIQNVDAATADVVKNKFSTLFTIASGRYTLSFSSCDQRLQGELEVKRAAIEDTLASFQKKSSVITTLSSQSTIDATFEAAYQAALVTNELVNTASNLLLAPCSLSNYALESERAKLSLAKSAMTALFSDISAKRIALNTAKNSFNQATKDLELVQAGTDPYKIQAQAASVASYEAQVAQAKSNLAKTIIKAPFAGVVSKVDLSFGETATLGKTVVTMIATDGYEVEAKVPEIDIVKVKVGAPVKVTLDAYGKTTVFPASVTRINPTASIEGTVPVYKVIVTFSTHDERIKEGMTANVQILTTEKSGVIVIPARFVLVTSATEGTVTKYKNGKEFVQSVALGVRGSDGTIEVTGGLVEGDELLPPVTTTRQAQKQNN